MIGAAPAPVAPTGIPPESHTVTAGAVPYDPSNPMDVMAFMTQVPETVMFDLASKMMAGAGPTVVEVPFAQPPDGVPQEMTGEPGSEQLAPGDRVAIRQSADGIAVS